MSEVRHAFRSLSQSRGLTAVIVLTLALGIGANTAVFSLVEGVLLQPLPYREPGRLVDVLDSSPREQGLAKIFASYRDLQEYARHAQTIDGIGAVTWAARPSAVLTGRGRAKSYLTIATSSTFFSTLGVTAARGRTFSASDLDGGCSVVLSHKFWRTELGADPAIAGRSLTLDDRACTVRGVMPANFAFYPPETEMWRLIQPNDAALKGFYGVFMVARLKPGTTAEQVRTELASLHAALHGNDADEKSFVPIVSNLQDQFTWLAGRNLRSTLAILGCAVMLVLSIGCINVANLLLGRSATRARELAIRAALGAGRARIVQLLAVEAAILAAAGGAGGLALAWAALRYFVHASPIELPVGALVGIDPAALAFTAAISLVTAAAFGVAPALTLSRTDLNTGLRMTMPGVGPGRQRLTRALIVAEMALSLTLLCGAGLLMRSMLSYTTAPLGFSPEDVYVANSSLPAKRYGDATRKSEFYRRLEERLAALPGVEATAIASTLPPYGLGLDTLDVEGRVNRPDARRHDVGQSAISGGYFRTLQMPVLGGRTFTAADQAQTAPVAVVNRALVHEYFEDADAIGRRIRVGASGDWLTIVGVVANERRQTVFQEMNWVEAPAVYRPMVQRPSDAFSIAVRSNGAGAGMGRAIEQTVAAIDGEVALGAVEPLNTRLAANLKYPRFRAIVLAAFATLAILLAAIGLYGVLAQFVAQRTREIGVRMAVGAGRLDILQWIAKQGGMPVAMGAVLGFALSFGLTRYLTGLLYGVTAQDPLTFAAVAGILVLAAAIAMALPARRASKLDPLVALREE